ncbi:MAG: hypothetical protein AAF799_12760 [Myxococcota bacterium]
MTEPDDSLRRAYEAYRHRASPSTEARAELWDALGERIAQGDAGPSLHAAEPEPAPSRSYRGVAIVLGLAAAGLLLFIGADLGGVLTRTEVAPSGSQASDFAVRPSTPGEAVSREAPRKATTTGRKARTTPRSEVVPEAVDSAVVEPEEPPAPSPAIDEPAPRRSSGRSSGKRTPSPNAAVPEPVEAPEPSSIIEEAALLRRARGAMNRGDSERALELARSHAQRFPEGALGPERGLLEIDALCALERVPEARTAAARYARSYPDSGWNARIARSCARP